MWVRAKAAASDVAKASCAIAPVPLALAPPPAAVAAAPAVAKSNVRRREPEAESEVAYLRRRLHNSQRAGRNRLYYQMLNLHGPEVAAPYWLNAWDEPRDVDPKSGGSNQPPR